MLCYQVISYGLKNVGETYQCIMTKILYDLLHVIIEDYVDDLLGDSKMHESHITILTTIFERLEKYKVWLNPKKCVFGVQSSKLLGYIVWCRGIEVNPMKWRAILDMYHLTKLKICSL